MKPVYLFAAIVGTLIPWFFFGTFFVDNGLNLIGFIQAVFANDPARGFTADILISIAVFWAWSYWDARQLGVQGWWLTVPSCFFVGLSLGLPLYLYLRHDRASAMTRQKPS